MLAASLIFHDYVAGGASIAGEGWYCVAFRPFFFCVFAFHNRLLRARKGDGREVHDHAKRMFPSCSPMCVCCLVDILATNLWRTPLMTLLCQGLATRTTIPPNAGTTPEIAAPAHVRAQSSTLVASWVLLALTRPPPVWTTTTSPPRWSRTAS